MYVGCPGMYKTDTNIKAQKSSFCEGDERNLTVFLKKKKKMCPLFSKTEKKNLVVAWCLYRMCSLLYWLVSTRPALFKWTEGDSERTHGDHRRLAVVTSRESWGLLEDLDSFFWKCIGKIYCMLSTGQHTRTISTSVCVPKHANRSARKRTGGDWIVLHCCGITGTYSLYMWHLNSVV